MPDELALIDSTAIRGRAVRTVCAAAARAEQGDLLRRYHVEGDLAARARLAEQLLPLARSLAARYINRNEPYDDLVQVASVGLMKAIDRFDVSRNVAFSSFATPTILGEIKRYFRDRTWAVRPPRDVQELQPSIAMARDILTSELGREPTIGELANAVNTCQEKVLAAIEANGARRARSIFESAGEDLTLGDTLGCSDPELARAEARVQLDGGMKILPERERTILKLRFQQELTQQQIADVIGVSQMQVSRLIRRSVDRLRSEIGDNGSAAQSQRVGPIERAV